MPRFQHIIIAIIATITLSSCGTKGPLYIPEKRYPQTPDGKPATPAPIKSDPSNVKE